MNFDDYCHQIADDKQEVAARFDTLVNFTNSKGQSFQITPEVIVKFLEFCKQNWSEVELTWEAVELHRERINLYEEKSYRAVYKLANGKQGIEIIGSLGGSQTQALAKLIAKIVSFVLKEQYTDVKEDSFFDIERITNFLVAVSHESLNSLIRPNHKASKHVSNAKETFKNWLVHSEKLSESTARKYSVDAPQRIESILANSDFYPKIFYSFNTPAEVEKLKTFLEGNEEWGKYNNNGHSMYSSALSKYASFVEASAITPQTYLPKPFILLAGISGTGKTQFVREQAKASGSLEENYELVAVRPDWHEPSDLLGYISRLGDRPEYIPTKTLSFIAKAWQNLNPIVQKDDTGNIWWTAQNQNNAKPYWLCLDEMNLAPVEQYFSDYLSVLETRKFQFAEGMNHYQCEPLVHKDIINGLKEESQRKLQKDLSVSDELFDLFKNYGIPLPYNLIVAGTVNMDETTHGFSRKVIDRALSIDFGVFFENNFDQFFEGQPTIKPLTYSAVCDARQPQLFDDLDNFKTASVEFLSEINAILRTTPFELAFRSLNELLLTVYCFKPRTEDELSAVWDDFLMSKVLPRIEGDIDKLSNNDENILEKLSIYLKAHSIFGSIAQTQRVDLFREKSTGEPLMTSCRSLEKIKWMNDRLNANGYTSFWP